MTLGEGVLEPELERSGPLDPGRARGLLARADELLAAAEFPVAARYYQRLIGATGDRTATAAALFGLGMALFRMDREDEARAMWEQILNLPETPFTYRAWRELAGMRVRDRDLAGAERAYREAERRAPPGDRAEIASRLGWLSKERGDERGASRYFSRSRAGIAAPFLTYSIIAVTAIVSILAFDQGERGWLFRTLQLDKPAVAAGEYWRLWTVTLLHGNYLHLFFNMYALYLAGALVEQLYGWKLFAVFYLLAAAAGSVGSFLFGGDVPSVGASGAIFGLFGVLLAVSRTHQPVLDRRGQALLGQMGVLIVINLIFSVAVPGIDISAHVGGLMAGLWLGFLLVPGQVPTLGSLWQSPGGPIVRDTAGLAALRMLGVLALVIAIVLGLAVGTGARQRQAAAVQVVRGAVVEPSTVPVAPLGFSLRAESAPAAEPR